jgi:hypothetical protein
MAPAVSSCIVCKGARYLCGLSSCPVLGKFKVKTKISPNLKDDFSGKATSVFIGRRNYPDVFAGPLAPITGENVHVVDSPSSWFGMDYSAIVEMRSELLRSKSSVNVFSRGRTVEDMREIALSSKPPEIEMKFSSKPVYRVSFSDVLQPMGPSASLRKLTITENIHVERRVEKIITDELSAARSGFGLYRAGQDVYKISSILSSGALGLESRRKLVPTRWSITASQTMVADRLIEEIRDFPSVNDFMVFSSSYLDNHFEVLLMPGAWEFENFEAWAPGTAWSSGAPSFQVTGEYEPNGGRSGYAESQGGGFYASRLGVAEGLRGLRRQARVIVFREVGEGYIIPLGVWQVLENVRNAFRQHPARFATRGEALSHIKSKLRVSMDRYAGQSTMLKQKKLNDFF